MSALSLSITYFFTSNFSILVFTPLITSLNTLFKWILNIHSNKCLCQTSFGIWKPSPRLLIIPARFLCQWQPILSYDVSIKEFYRRVDLGKTLLSENPEFVFGHVTRHSICNGRRKLSVTLIHYAVSRFSYKVILLLPYSRIQATCNLLKPSKNNMNIF